MRLITGQCVLIIAIIISSYAVNAGIVKRDATQSTSVSDPPGSGGPETSSLQQVLQSLISFSLQIPLIGSLLVDVIEKLVELILAVELLTNGAVARLLGGALPCVVSLNGFQCSGITKNGGLIQLLENVVNNLPDLLIPVFLKDLINLLLRAALAPVIDLLFGGLPEIQPAS